MPEAAGDILTKILATVGPASSAVPVLVRLIEEGVRCFRLNFSHGTFDDFGASLRNIRAAAAQVGMPIGVLGDLSGPKIRLGAVEGGQLQLEAGDTVEFVRAEGVSRREPGTGVVLLSTNYSSFVDEVDAGHRVYVDDGAVRMLCTDRQPGDGRLTCRVTTGGPISNRKGVNLPDTTLSLPSLTDWDRACVEWAIAHDVDYLALSFVRQAADVRELKALLKALGRDNTGVRTGTKLPVVAKLEKPQAITDLENICRESDAVMVARGDLGVEMELAQVPVIQKQIVRVAHDYGKPVIVATQMLQSMIENPSPTRAEVSDVANAILDGADAVMLSGETAVGAYPVQAVRAMARTAANAEAYHHATRGDATRAPRHLQTSRYRTAALAHGVSVVVKDLGAKFVVTWSELGGGALHLSQNRLAVPIVAVSSNEAALRQMTLLFGVTPVHMARPASSDAFLHALDNLFQSRGWGAQGDPIVIAKGEPLGTPGVMNHIQIHYLGDVCRLTWHAKS